MTLTKSISSFGDDTSKVPILLGNALLVSVAFLLTFERHTSRELASPWPRVAIAVFVVKPVPYVEEFLERLSALDYPKERLDLWLFNNQPYNAKLVVD